MYEKSSLGYCSTSVSAYLYTTLRIINPLVINYTFENLSDHYTNTGCSPFEVFYGRQSNFETSSATGGEDI